MTENCHSSFAEKSVYSTGVSAELKALINAGYLRIAAVVAKFCVVRNFPEFILDYFLMYPYSSKFSFSSLFIEIGALVSRKPSSTS